MSESNTNEQQPWYRQGLRFQCTECGQCCTGSPGYVWVTEQEIASIADYIKLSNEEFIRRYVRVVGERLALLEHATNFDCVFLKDKKCQIYPVRPKQCRTFPWWPGNLKTAEEWQKAARYCEGISMQAAVVPFPIIQEQLAIQEKA